LTEGSVSDEFSDGGDNSWCTVRDEITRFEKMTIIGREMNIIFTVSMFHKRTRFLQKRKFLNWKKQERKKEREREKERERKRKRERERERKERKKERGKRSTGQRE
jgi:hypothetical protein